VVGQASPPVVNAKQLFQPATGQEACPTGNGTEAIGRWFTDENGTLTGEVLKEEGETAEGENAGKPRKA
jgi:hypothetical protein